MGSYGATEFIAPCGGCDVLTIRTRGGRVARRVRSSRGVPTLLEGGDMADPSERQRERELERRRQQELKDLETEDDHRERPLEGLSSAPTTWTQEQDESDASRVHGDDESKAHARSVAQVTPAPANRTLSDGGDGERGP